MKGKSSLDRFAEAPARKAAKVPYDFVLDELAPLAPVTRPMFGCTAVYVGERIVLILRQKGGDDDGVWLATTEQHHASLAQEFPAMRSITVFGPGVSGWQVLPEDAADFEDAALRACALVRARDPRIGKVPASKKKPATPKPAAPKRASR